MSQFAQTIQNFQGRFGALFVALFVMTTALPHFANADDSRHSEAVLADMRDKLRSQIRQEFERIQLPLSKAVKIDGVVTLDHSSGEPWVRNLVLNIDLGNGIPAVAAAQIERHLLRWLRAQGYNSGEEAPQVALHLKFVSHKPMFNFDIRPYFVIAAVILVPIFGFFLFIGFKWQWQHSRSLRRGKRLYEESRSEPAVVIESSSLPLQPDDMKNIFSDMSLTQAISFLKPLSPKERQEVFQTLNLHKPVQRLVLEELAKQS